MPLPASTRRCGARLLLAAALLAAGATPSAAAGGASPNVAAGGTYAERAHARAVESFRLGRFAEAYGRFVDLAEAGHGPSARYALWMCEQGPALFGKEWDCSPQQAGDWARAAGVAAPPVQAISRSWHTAAKGSTKR